MKFYIILLLFFSRITQATCPLPDFSIFDINQLPSGFFQENCSEKNFLENKEQLCECSKNATINKFDYNPPVPMETQLAEDYYRYFESSLLSISSDVSELGKNSNLSPEETNEISKSCLLDQMSNIQCGNESNLNILKNKFKEDPVIRLRSKMINELSYLNSTNLSLYGQNKNDNGLMIREFPENSCNLPDTKINDLISTNIVLSSIEISRQLKNYKKSDYDYHSIYTFLQEQQGFDKRTSNVLQSKSPILKSIFSSKENTEMFFKALKDGQFVSIDDINQLLSKPEFKTSLVNDLTNRCKTTFNEFKNFLCNPVTKNKISSLETFKKIENVKRTSKPKLNKQPLPEKEIEKINDIVDVHEKIEWYCKQEQKEETDFEKSFNHLFESLPQEFKNGGLQPQSYSASAYSEIKKNREFLCSVTPPKGEVANKLKELGCGTELKAEESYDCRMLLLYQLSLKNGSSILLGKNPTWNEIQKKENNLVINIIGNTSKYTQKEIEVLKKSGLYKSNQTTEPKTARTKKETESNKDIQITPDQSFDTTISPNNKKQITNGINNKPNNSIANNQVSNNQNDSKKSFKDKKREIQEEIIKRLMDNQEKTVGILKDQNEEIRNLIKEDPETQGLSESEINDIIKKYTKEQKKVSKNKNNEDKKDQNRMNSPFNKEFTNIQTTNNNELKDNNEGNKQTQNTNIANNQDEQVENNNGNGLPIKNNSGAPNPTNLNPQTNQTQAEATQNLLTSLVVDQELKQVKLTSIDKEGIDLEKILTKADEKEINELEKLIQSQEKFVISTADGFKVEVTFADGKPIIKKLYDTEKPGFVSFEKELIEFLNDKDKRKFTIDKLNHLLKLGQK